MNQTETRICESCKQNFTIESEDFTFYEKIKVPPPTWCPQCRLQRRLAAFNHRTLYRRKCDLCKNNMIAMYHADVPFPVYCPSCWWSDKWDPLSYGREIDFIRPFLTQVEELRCVVPHVSLMGLHSTWINSEYNNFAHALKNCYLLFNSDIDENCSYGSEVESSKDCVDVMMIEKSEFVYQSINITNSYKIFFSVDCDNCQDVWFSKNLVNCSDCFGCVSLRNKKYHIFNQPYSKKDYLTQLRSFETGSYEEVAKFLKKFCELEISLPNRFIHGTQNLNVSGDYVNHSKNTRDSYIATGAENCRYCMWLLIAPSKDSYDYTQFGGSAENMYETAVCGKNVSDIQCSLFVVDGSYSIRYSEQASGRSHDLFGCAYIRSNSYCILNKQYSKEEYEALVPKIIEHMNTMPYIDKQGREYPYGEFFPAELSPFAYNESIAQEYFPLTKDKAIVKGYSFHDPDTKSYKTTLESEKIPDDIKEIKDDILQETIGCIHKGSCNQQCATAFRIIPDELRFYRQFNLPIPRLCSNCRHYERLQKINPFQLWQRSCGCKTNSHFHGNLPCSNKFETTYAPDRPEIVYCEQCYNAEVV